MRIGDGIGTCLSEAVVGNHPHFRHIRLLKKTHYLLHSDDLRLSKACSRSVPLPWRQEELCRVHHGQVASHRTPILGGQPLRSKWNCRLNMKPCTQHNNPYIKSHQKTKPSRWQGGFLAGSLGIRTVKGGLTGCWILKREQELKEKNNLNYCPKDDQREGPVAAPTQDCSRTEPADARGNQRAIAEEFGLVIPGERDVLPYVWGSE